MKQVLSMCGVWSALKDAKGGVAGDGPPIGGNSWSRLRSGSVPGRAGGHGGWDKVTVRGGGVFLADDLHLLCKVPRFSLGFLMQTR